MKFTVKHALITCIGLAILAMLLPWVEIGGLLGFSGVQIACTLGVSLGFMGDVTGLLSALGSYLPTGTSVAPTFGETVLAVLILLAALAPFVLTIINLFLSIFGNSKKVSKSVLVTEIITTVLALAYLIGIIALVNSINNVNILSASAGVFIFLAASLASVIVSVMIMKRHHDISPKRVKGDPSDKGILCLVGEYQGMVIPMADGQTLVLGRDASCCSLVLSGGKISRKHCEITYDGARGIYRVTDLSTNGTFINGGTRLERDRVNELPSNTVLQLGNEQNMFRLQ